MNVDSRGCYHTLETVERSMSLYISLFLLSTQQLDILYKESRVSKNRSSSFFLKKFRNTAKHQKNKDFTSNTQIANQPYRANHQYKGVDPWVGEKRDENTENS